MKLPQKAVAPKNGVRFDQKSIGAVRCSLAMSYDDWRRRSTPKKLTGTDEQAAGQANLCFGKLRLQKLT